MKTTKALLKRFLDSKCFLFVADNQSRVILSGDEKSDYINASYIDVSKYIIKNLADCFSFCISTVHTSVYLESSG